MKPTFTTWGKRNRKDRQIALLTARIPDQETLDRMLRDARPELRLAVFERLQPHLKFDVDPAELASLSEIPPNGEAADRTTATP